MLEISMGESCVQVFLLINGSPQTEPVSGGCADNGTDSNYIVQKGKENGSCFVPWLSRPCFVPLKKTQYVQVIFPSALGLLAPWFLL